MPYWDRIPRIDRRHAIKGVLFSSMTLWRLPFNSNDVDAVVLADTAFGSNEGKVILVANCGGATVYTNGDYTAGCVLAGVNFTATMTLSEFTVRNEQGITVNQGELQLRDLTVRHRQTGKYKIKIQPDSTLITDRETTFEAASNGIDAVGRKRSFIGVFSDKVTIKIDTDSPKPATISTVEVEADFSDKSG